VAYQHVNAAVPAPSSVRGGVPKEIDALVARATARDADDRYPDAASFLADVREARRGLPVPRPFGVTEDQAATLVVPLATSATATPAAAATKGGAGVPRKRRRRGWIPLLAVLLAGALVAGVAWFYGAAHTVAVPSVYNLTPSAASAKLAPLGLSLDASATGYSETVPAGKIISTDPAPGADARRDSTVSAVVSKGPERHAVPAVAAMSVADATQAVTDASLTVGGTTQAYDPKIATGAVVTATPAPGTKLKRGQAVTLIVSKGPAPVPLPSFVGKPADQTVAALTKLGLKSTSTSAYSKTVPSGSVVSTSPKAGTPLPKGSSVALVVSKGPPLVVVPDLYRTAEADARTTLTGLGFKVVVSYPIGFTPFGRVVRQSVDAGTSAPWGSTIRLDVV